MTRIAPVLAFATIATFSPLAADAADPIETVIAKLNGDIASAPDSVYQYGRSVLGTPESKSYPILFDAYLELSEPPFPVGPDFNLTTIHPGMSGWTQVAGWAESNPTMAEAIRETEAKTLFGLPYGMDNVESRYREAGLYCGIGEGGTLRDNRFPYLHAIDTIAAYATAEAYRLLEAGDYEAGFDLYLANLFVLRQCCDREFLVEVSHSIQSLLDALSNLRDIYYFYHDGIKPPKYRDIATNTLPFLRPDRNRLFMPEGDKLVAEELIREVFNANGQADPEKFYSTFAAIQSEDDPLERFGAARRWRMVADIHDSEEASLERLKLIYDDWWRRWRVQEYDPILDVAPMFERTNRVRFAAVIYSMQNLESLFPLRNQLIAAVHGTAMATAVVGYREEFGTYPRDPENTYATFVRKRTDRDPFDQEFQPFKYYIADERVSIDARGHRIWVEAGDCVLYSKGQDNEDDRGREHTDDGRTGDIVFWPAITAMLREAGYEE
jgi:hypothetical protein